MLMLDYFRLVEPPHPNAPVLPPSYEDLTEVADRRMTMPATRTASERRKAPKMAHLPEHYKKAIVLTEEELYGPRGFLESLH